MDQEAEQKIRRLAYELWLAAGKPEGSSLRFWKEAEAVLTRTSRADENDGQPEPKE